MFGKGLTIAALSALTAVAFADGPVRSFSLEPAAFSVKAGEKLAATATIECEDGYEMRGWALRVLRKHAPAEFFAAPGLPIKPHGKAPAYDAVEAVPHRKFSKPITNGSFPVRLHTAGMKVGDYAFSLQGHFMKDGKSFYQTVTLPVTITENDDKTFAATPQPTPTPEYCSLFELTPYYAELTPNYANLAAGEKMVVRGRVRPVQGMKVTGWSVNVIRKCAPKEFFDRPGAPVIKHAKFKDYDVIHLRKYVPETPTDELNFTFELDTTGVPAGEYHLNFSAPVVEDNNNKKKYHYPQVSFSLNIR